MSRAAVRALALLLMLSGCAAQASRAPRTLTNVADLVLSNAPAVQDAKQPCARGERLVIDYGLFAENRGAARAVLELVAARAALAEVGQAPGEQTFRIACLEHEPARRAAPVAVLEPGERTRIDCEIELTHELAAPLRDADRELVLALPVHTAERSALVFFGYRLQAGDAP